MEPLIFILFCLLLAGIYALRYYNYIGYPSSFSLLPFQSGVLYRRGRPIREVGPGRHRVFSGIERILFLDTRPIQVNFEGRAVALTDGATAVYGYSASAKVCDARKALYASANYTQIPAFVTLCVARRTLNQCTADKVGIGRAALEDDIASACRSRLESAGFELISFRFTQLGIAMPAPQAPSINPAPQGQSLN